MLNKKAAAILDSTDFDLPYGLVLVKEPPRYFLARFGDDNYFGAIPARRMLRLLKKGMFYEALAICERRKRESLNR
ncbi:hypothetical protein DRN75_00860 [Nanoarchaeota archaeon]|nr:MAG: hypothetical protein DRN75_00860 [Nanoarchaeota archaeon]